MQKEEISLKQAWKKSENHLLAFLGKLDEMNLEPPFSKWSEERSRSLAEKLTIEDLRPEK